MQSLLILRRSLQYAHDRFSRARYQRSSTEALPAIAGSLVRFRGHDVDASAEGDNQIVDQYQNPVLCPLDSDGMHT